MAKALGVAESLANVAGQNILKKRAKLKRCTNRAACEYMPDLDLCRNVEALDAKALCHRQPDR